MFFEDLDDNMLVDIREAARLASCSKSKLDTDRSHNRGLPYYKTPGGIRYRVGDIREAIESSRVMPKVGAL